MFTLEHWPHAVLVDVSILVGNILLKTCYKLPTIINLEVHGDTGVSIVIELWTGLECQIATVCARIQIRYIIIYIVTLEWVIDFKTVVVLTKRLLITRHRFLNQTAKRQTQYVDVVNWWPLSGEE